MDRRTRLRWIRQLLRMRKSNSSCYRINLQLWLINRQLYRIQKALRDRVTSSPDPAGA
jgi:hypothetical protein